MADLSDSVLGASGPSDPGSRPGIAVGSGTFGALARKQYRALARMRWRMFANGLRSKKGALELGARTVSYVIYAFIGLGMAAGGGALTYALLADDKLNYLPIVFWVLAFIWQMIPIMLASFQEQFDMGILLRFPVRFGSYLLLYLVFGLVDISTILGGLCCVGICVGAAIARPDLIGWTALSLAVFAAFNILLVRAIFAWIERWLAQRKTREIMGAIFMVAVLSIQLFNPALYQHRDGRRRGHAEQAEQLRDAQTRFTPFLKKIDAAQQWLPPGLAAVALRQASEQQPVEGLGSIAVLGFYSLLVSGILALRLKAEYRGENLGVAPTQAKVAAKRVRVTGAAMASPDRQACVTAGASSAIAAIMEKDIRSLMRTLPLLYAIGAPLVLVLVFATMFVRNGGAQTSMFPFALPVCMVYAQLGFTQIFYNNLGTEGAGIQLYFLSPTSMRTVMLAKNLLHCALFAVVAVVAGVLSALRLGVPDVAVAAATGAWLLFALPSNLAAGILFSLKMPYRVNPGRISRQRGSQANALLSLLVQIGFLAVGAAVFAVTWFLGRIWLAVPIFLVLAAIATFVWKQVLDTADTVASERRDALMATLMKES